MLSQIRSAFIFDGLLTDRINPQKKRTQKVVMKQLKE
jgi:hypothetical protein